MSAAVPRRADEVAARYSAAAMWLHWIIAAVIVVNVVIGLFHDSWPRSFGGPAMGFHKASGISVLFLSFGRLALRLIDPPPPFAPHLKRWEKLLAHITHRLFYALMIGIPLTGWVFTSAATKPRPLAFFGLFDVPRLPVPVGDALSHTFREGHELLAYGVMALLVLHVAGALKHQLIDRDNELGRMVPGMGPGRAGRGVERPDP